MRATKWMWTVVAALQWLIFAANVDMDRFALAGAMSVTALYAWDIDQLEREARAMRGGRR